MVLKRIPSFAYPLPAPPPLILRRRGNLLTRFYLLDSWSRASPPATGAKWKELTPRRSGDLARTVGAPPKLCLPAHEAERGLPALGVADLLFEQGLSVRLGCG
jgi:hypothetical protein